MKKFTSRPYELSIALFLALFLALCLIFLFVCTGLFPMLFSGQAHPYQAAVSLNAFAGSKDYFTVVLDAGHGGYDSGARSAGGLLEKDLNLAVTQKVAAFLNLFDVHVVLTRSGDDPPDLIEGNSRKRTEILSRAKIAAETEADLFLSIHMNSFPQAKCSGSQVFFSAQNPENETFARTLQSALESLLQTDNTRTAKETDLILLLRHIECPGALLECGFLSNEEEAEMLNDERYQSKLAFCISSAIVSFLSNR